MKKLQKTIKNNLEDDFRLKYQRALADYHNLTKQTEKEKSDTIRFANSQIISDLIPVFEYLKISLSHSDENSAITEGLKYTLNLFQKVLHNHGVIEINPVSKQFDHHSMEAVESINTDDHNQDNLVSEVKQCGYQLNDKIIQPARVIVFKFKEAEINN